MKPIRFVCFEAEAGKSPICPINYVRVEDKSYILSFVFERKNEVGEGGFFKSPCVHVCAAFEFYCSSLSLWLKSPTELQTSMCCTEKTTYFIMIYVLHPTPSAFTQCPRPYPGPPQQLMIPHLHCSHCLELTDHM